MEEYGPLGEIWSHLPSLGVVVGVNRQLLMNSLSGAGIETREARKIRKMSEEERIASLGEMGLADMWIPQIRWVMPEIGMNNGSSGTGFVALPYLVEEGLIRQDQAILTLGFGVGSVWQANVINFPSREKQLAS